MSKNNGTGGMTRRDRDDLAALMRKQEKLGKTEAAERAAFLRADVERQLAATCEVSDERWAAITAAAKKAVAAADTQIAEICRDQGVQERFRPELCLDWYSRGENAIQKRREELRKVAVTRIAALEKEARTKIECRSVEIQMQLVAGGLESDAARAFLASMPTAAQLMPPIAVAEIEAALFIRDMT